MSSVNPPSLSASVGLSSGSGRRPGTDSIWFLAGHIDETDVVRYLPIHTFPFKVGRRTDISLCLPRKTVSNVHAEIIEMNGQLIVRDLKSTNGTYVNAAKVQTEVALKEGDLVQFADVAFRLRRQAGETDGRTVHENVVDRALALVQFDKLMSQRAVVPYFQPIVTMTEDHKVVGHEVLGRSRLFGLESPMAMFYAASQLDLEVELSRMFRWEGIREGMSIPGLTQLFVNTHPVELVKPGLVDSLRAIRDVNPSQPITLEIHEAAVTDLKMMHELSEALKSLKIGLAYDDFGAGQTRLIELVEVRPDYLKFDMTLVQGIDKASEKRQQMLATLVRMVHELGIVPLAEGVETEGESLACRQIGFELGQGFFFGKPAPARPEATL